MPPHDTSPPPASTSPRARLQHLAEVLGRHRFRFTSELQLQDAIARAFASERVVALREQALTLQDRPDFLVGDLAVEVKVGGSLSDALRQLHRYAQHEDVAGLLLVTSRLQHTDVPETMTGKPVRAVHVGGAFV